MFCDYSKLVTLHKKSEVHFRLLGMNCFHAKTKNERFTAENSRCRQNLKYENFTSSFGRLRQKNAPKSVPRVQHDYFSTFSQSYHDWFVALPLQSPLQSSFFKLPNRKNGDSDVHDMNELSFMIWMSWALANVQRRTCAVHACFFFLSQ